MEEMLRQMRGDFSGETDPERRRILEKLAKKGMSFGGGGNMDTEQVCAHVWWGVLICSCAWMRACASNGG